MPVFSPFGVSRSKYTHHIDVTNFQTQQVHRRTDPGAVQYDLAKVPRWKFPSWGWGWVGSYPEAVQTAKQWLRLGGDVRHTQ